MRFGLIGRIVVAMPKAASSFNWKAKYSKFVQLYFDGDMPRLGSGIGEVILRVRQTKGATGRTSSKWRRYDATLVAPITITMSPQLLMEEEEIEDIFIHEMIHAYWMHQGNYQEQHGPRFHAKSAEISRKRGRQIPLTHDARHLELNPEFHAQAKPVGILVFQSPKIPKPLLALISEKMLRQDMDYIVERAAFMMNSRYKSGSIHIYVDRHPLQHDLPIQRSKRLKWFYVDRAKLAELLDGATPLKKLEYDPHASGPELDPRLERYRQMKAKRYFG